MKNTKKPLKCDINTQKYHLCVIIVYAYDIISVSLVNLMKESTAQGVDKRYKGGYTKEKKTKGVDI